MATRRAAVLGLDERQFENLVFATVLTGFVLSHVLDTIFYHPEVLRDAPWEIVMIHHGLSSFGGFFGAAIGFGWYAHRHRIDPWRSADAICYGLPLGWLFGRAGCATVHDHPGHLSNSALAVNYPLPGQTGARFGIFRINPASAPGVPRFDLGVLELMLTPVLIAIALYVGHRTRKPGAVVASLALVYPVIRFPLDFLRATERDNGDVRYFGLTPGQYACVLLFFLGLWILRRTWNLPPTPPAQNGADKPGTGARGKRAGAPTPGYRGSGGA
jgi:phosphatidylglycerol:prolipoprotein diacylglycerol transferase